jgi:hypothetical protein
MVIRYEGPKGGPGMRETLAPTSAIIGGGLGDSAEPQLTEEDQHVMLMVASGRGDPMRGGAERVASEASHCVCSHIAISARP